ncbi:MAG: 3-phosphoglycerate dehydrogenase [Candidatus Aminicenantes bacterium]|nr:3-phosphoglycerate dehydrogenase [Candidatus Aminicenantes bacterium]
MIRILLADKLNLRVVELLREIPEFDIVEKISLKPDKLKEEIRNHDAAVVRSAVKLTSDILEHAQNLKIIVRAGIGLDNVDVAYAGSRNIEVRNTPFATSITVAEYTLAHMLGICRFIGPAYKSMKEHKWEKGILSKGMELYGKTAGIIGFGRIGREVAKRELAMGMKVVYFDTIDIETDIEVRQVTLDELLTISDFISIHLPLTESTENLISGSEFDKMKKNVVLINVARGGVVDETALLTAVQEDKIKAVAIDVYEKEPPVNFKLIDNEKVFPAPHLGASTIEGQERAGLNVISILKDFFTV